MTHDGEPELIHQTQALSHSGLLLGDAAGRFSTEEARTGHAQPRAGEKPEICPLLGDLLFLSDACILRPNQIQRANQGFYIRSRAAAVPLSPCLLTCSSSFTKLLKTAEHLQREVQTSFLIFLSPFKSSLLRRRQLSQDIMQMGEKKKKECLYFIRQDPRNGRAAGNIVSHAVDLTERPLRVFPQVTVWKGVQCK